MKTKKSHAKKVVPSERLKKAVIEPNNKVVKQERKIRRNNNITNEMTAKVKNHWCIIQKDFRLLADDVSFYAKEVKEIISEKGVARMRDIQMRMNTKFAWK